MFWKYTFELLPKCTFFLSKCTLFSPECSLFSTKFMFLRPNSHFFFCPNARFSRPIARFFNFFFGLQIHVCFDTTSHFFITHSHTMYASLQIIGNWQSGQVHVRLSARCFTVSVHLAGRDCIIHVIHFDQVKLSWWLVSLFFIHIFFQWV